MVTGLARFSAASREVQRFFREWAAADDDPAEPAPSSASTTSTS